MIYYIKWVIKNIILNKKGFENKYSIVIYVMVDLPMEVIDLILRFNSHPVADMIRNHTVITELGRYIRTPRSIHNIYDNYNNSIDHHFETYVIGKHIRNHLNVEYITHDNVKQFDELFLHCHKDQIETLIDGDQWNKDMSDHLEMRVREIIRAELDLN